MFKFRYSKKRQQYTAYLNINDLNENPVELEIKFDTGAVSTVISANKIFGRDLSDSDLEDIKKQINEKTIKKHAFKSASGHIMSAYPCCYKDVVLAGCKFEYFKFYVVLENTANIAVVGDDFISCCSFVHTLKSDIVINGFDNELYKKHILINENALETIELFKKHAKYNITDIEANYINRKISFL